MASKAPIHILLVSFPAQGHISPLLRLGKHLAAKGFFVTFSYHKSIGEHMEAASTISATPIDLLVLCSKNPKSLSTSTKICGDSFKVDDDCIDWLNSRSPASVVYICFANQREEALQSGVLPDGFFEKINERGSKVVEWSPQEDVLAHPSVACYFSHCGWNSTVEAVSLGVPVLTFSQFSDQVTNAKLLVDVFKVGIRVNRHLLAENVIVNRDEITKCLLEATTGPRAKELKENALKWKNAAEAARAQGGSSDRHLDAFVEDIKKYIAMNKKKIHS
ncbi:UDP-glucuronosyl/UDP-glucosyltransferase [Sesbania bispinosa]|nr:UDP-glucuronosyl/UDP-glucosyltransferase [Sesbania bispinosa]